MAKVSPYTIKGLRERINYFESSVEGNQLSKQTKLSVKPFIRMYAVPSQTKCVNNIKPVTFI